MARDPFGHVEDAPLFIVPRVLEALRAYRPLRFDEHRSGDTVLLGALRERLLAGVERHPTKFWVMKQFREILDTVDALDGNAPARQQLRAELERLMDILGIDSSDGALGHDIR